MATNNQKGFAQKLLDGEHHSKVLKGQKIRAFAHLIEHGGNEKPENPQVVVDRHAYSVAAGGRMSDMAFGQTNLKSQKGYNKVKGAYVEAAKHLSEQHGRTIHPHQVQAVTWLVRQRLNKEEEAGNVGKKGVKGPRGTAKVMNGQKANWTDYASKHHPSVVGKEPGTGWHD